MSGTAPAQVPANPRFLHCLLRARAAERPLRRRTSLADGGRELLALQHPQLQREVACDEAHQPAETACGGWVAGCGAGGPTGGGGTQRLQGGAATCSTQGCAAARERLALPPQRGGPRPRPSKRKPRGRERRAPHSLLARAAVLLGVMYIHQLRYKCPGAARMSESGQTGVGGYWQRSPNTSWASAASRQAAGERQPPSNPAPPNEQAAQRPAGPDQERTQGACMHGHVQRCPAPALASAAAPTCTCRSLWSSCCSAGSSASRMSGW